MKIAKIDKLAPSNKPESLFPVANGAKVAESEINRAKHKTGFNGLTPYEWASLSKNVWNDLSSPRNRHQLEHGAVFPIKLAERLILMFSKKEDVILDPFAEVALTKNF